MIKIIKNHIIKQATLGVGHQYLVGNLKRKQTLQHIPDQNVNIGIGFHRKYEWEKPHYHTSCAEYQIVLKGQAKYVDLNRNKEHLVKKGDFFVIEKDTPYILKAKRGCKVLFMKSPAEDDKVEIPLTDTMKCWTKSWRTKWSADCTEIAKKKQPQKDPVFEEKNPLVEHYKKDHNLPITSPRSILEKEAIIDILRTSVKQLFAAVSMVIAVLSILTDLHMFPEKYYRPCGLMISGILLLYFIGRLIYYYDKYTNRNIKEHINQTDFVILEEDYVVNLIKLLQKKVVEQADEDISLVFAMGMNETILQNTAQEAIPGYTSITRDFSTFMKDYFNIDITKELQKKLTFEYGSPENYPKRGEVFDMKFTLGEPTKQAKDFASLKGCDFHVLFYINSKLLNNETEEVEDPRETVLHLIDACSDFLYTHTKGQNKKTIAMIPAIGTGKTGKGPFRNIVIEIINNLAMPNYIMPDELILSLRDYKVLHSEYEADKLLSLAKQINQKAN